MGNKRYVPVKWRAEWGIQFSMLQHPAATGYSSGGFDSGSGDMDAGPTAVYGKRRGSKSKNSGYYRAHTPQMQAQGHATTGAGIEAFATVTNRAYIASLEYRLWKGIESLSAEIASAIKVYGGVAICGRAYKMAMHNPDHPTQHLWYHDTYLMDAGPDVDTVFPGKPEPFVGPPQTVMKAPEAPKMSAAKFSAPPMMPKRDHQVEARFLVWARSLNG